VEESKRAIEGYLRAPKALRPAEIAKQLTLLSKHLTNAAGVASTLGEQGWLIMAISSGANREADDGDFTRHLLSRAARGLEHQGSRDGRGPCGIG